DCLISSIRDHCGCYFFLSWSSLRLEGLALALHWMPTNFLRPLKNTSNMAKYTSLYYKLPPLSQNIRLFLH
uniref:Uncharacterized protein n=1 Tax=Aegilops tauschii subsp. strangulata TaxID=200361 RepID=A0A453EGY6_AEGTS